MPLAGFKPAIPAIKQHSHQDQLDPHFIEPKQFVRLITY
jgi:hypothetical protein